MCFASAWEAWGVFILGDMRMCLEIYMQLYYCVYSYGSASGYHHAESDDTRDWHYVFMWMTLAGPYG